MVVADEGLGFCVSWNNVRLLIILVLNFIGGVRFFEIHIGVVGGIGHCIRCHHGWNSDD